ncbi:uncharacterized protein PADG_05363 [Paracoccidioides brasiliensis Pb18]|uniref:CFEM domain-containing protein n=1 Tax=Paracoccidioides brasiliensis (strain Pb18) TaxID=502780 RepID=C1GDM7_PARBD|nr:uncharacterized protein PADG_05363 [Paracoccidioides brasiliensis Pb18]EEH49284.2 hypothetical protein PADG_05363 [Paracoccidioides brasiliensis Pb18]
MKAIIALAGLLILSATAVCQDMSPVLNLAPCPRGCVFDTLGKAPDYGCSSSDVSCLCKSEGYQGEVKKCVQEKCTAEEVEALDKAGREVCDSAGAPIPPRTTTGADLTLPVPTVVLPTVNPLPEPPRSSVPSVPSVSSAPQEVVSTIVIPVPSVTPEVPSVSLPSTPSVPSLSVPPAPELPSVPVPSLPSIAPPSVPTAPGMGSMTVQPVSSSAGTTYMDPARSTSSAVSSSTIEPFLGAANMLLPVHAGAVGVGVLALII